MAKKSWYSIGEWDQPLLFTAIEAGFAETEYSRRLTPGLTGDYKVESRHFYFSQKALEQIKKYIKKPGLLDKYIRQHTKFLRDYEKLMRTYNFPKVTSNTQALAVFNTFVNATRNTSYFMDTGLLLDHAIMELLLKKIDFQTLSELVKPEMDLDVTKEIKSLRNLHGQLKKIFGTALHRNSNLRIISILKQKYPALYKRIERHRDSFAYLPMQTFRGKPWNLNDFIERIKTLPPLVVHNVHRKDAKKLDRQTKYYIKMTKLLNEYRTLRIEYVNKWIWALEPLWKYIAGKLMVNYSDVKNLSIDEITRCLQSNTVYPDKNELKLRNAAYSVLLKNGIFTYHSSPIKTSGSGNEFNTREIKGMPGNRGKVTGKVRIVRGVDEFKKFKVGEILVTSQTTPNFVSIMAKAKAIVTDQGGITSHAAIVSRELGVPCIIGTKVATQVLNDGDLIEVNANTGIITKL